MPKWFHITISVLLALLAIGFTILICGKHHWGYIPCAAIAIVLFACFYEFLRFCFWAGAKLTIAYADAFQKFIRPRIEVEAIQKYIAEHTVENPFNNLQLRKCQSITKSSIKRNAYADSWRFAKEKVNSSLL